MADLFSLLTFDAGNLNELTATAVTGTGAVSASNGWSYPGGGYCLQAAVTSGASSDRAQGRIAVANPGTGRYFLRWRMRWTTRGTYSADYNWVVCALKYSDDDIRATTGACLVMLMKPSVPGIILIAQDATGLVYCDFYMGISLNTTYEFQMMYDVSGANLQVRLWVDGAPLALDSTPGSYVFTGSGKYASTPDRFLIGGGAADASAQNYASSQWDYIQGWGSFIVDRRPNGILVPHMAPDRNMAKVRQ